MFFSNMFFSLNNFFPHPLLKGEVGMKKKKSELSFLQNNRLFNLKKINKCPSNFYT